jgi:hypothetical protein
MGTIIRTTCQALGWRSAGTGTGTEMPQPIVNKRR